MNYMYEESSKMHELLSDMQHHDSITGTSPNWIVDNYIKKIYKGINDLMPAYF